MWDERYRREEYVYGTKPNDFLRVKSSLIKPGGDVLCLAEGEGRNAVFLASLGFQVMAVDASTVGLNKAQQLASEKGVRIGTRVADLTEFGLGQAQWDAIVSIFCHVPPSIRYPLHRKVVQALKPNGLLILEAYRPEQLAYKTGGPSNAEMMMTEDTLHKELSGLTFIELSSLQRTVIEGTGHTGEGAVVQLVAKKNPLDDNSVSS